MVRYRCCFFKSLFFSIYLLFSSSYLTAQNYNWITPNKTYLKLYVIEDGIYRITRNEFTSAGINTSVIDPRTVKVYNKGSEIPIYFEGENDGSFDQNDFIDFYGTRNYGGLTNTYLATYGTMTVHYVTDEYYNPYSDTNIYWIGWDGPNGARLTISTYTSGIFYPGNFFLQKIHFEKDSLYSLGETINPNVDFRYFNNEKISGEGWYWRNLNPSSGMTFTQNFTITDLSSVPVSCTFRIFAYPNSRDNNPNEHKLILNVNSAQVATIERDDYNRFDTTVSFSSSLFNNGTNTINVTYQPNFGNPNITPSIYFDLVEITYPRLFRFGNNISRILLSGNDTTSKIFRVSGFNPSNPISIYDFRNNIKIVNISSNSDTLFFTGKSNGQFEIINENITRRPFRIIARQVPDLISSSNGADYIIVYHPLFESQAEQLRSHRQIRDGFRSVKVSVQNIIDIFNYGLEDPVALKRFINYAFSNWTQPSVQYVCLFGRGSLDPKGNRGNQPFSQNLIPVYGNPASDGYFANLNMNSFVYQKKISLGRIPVYTIPEANEVVNKIIAYDNASPEKWWKKFISITGGPNRNEQMQYQMQSNFLINTYISPPPESQISSKIYRNDSAGYITFNYADSIRKEINRGGMIVNFIGHAASQDWELGLEDPNILNNGGRLPLVLSMTCFTGKNSEPNFRGFGEKFLYYPNKGAIAFLGSTGWSFAGAGNEYNKWVLHAFSQDTIRRIGDLIKYATSGLAPDSLSFQVRNVINCYDLLGDPASKLHLPRQPEFVIRAEDYEISNPYPLIGETVQLKIFPYNLGLYAKDCLIRFQILRNGIPFRTKDTLISSFSFLKEAAYIFRLDTISNYSLKITLNADNRYPGENPSDNVLIIPLPLRNISFLPFKPIDNSITSSDSVEFAGLNPQINPANNNIKVILQLDTNASFTQPLFNLSNSNISGVITKFRIRIPFADSGKVYYWRTNSVINNDSTGWSETRRFMFNINYPEKILNDSVVRLYWKFPGQFNPGDISNISYENGVFRLFNFTGQLEVKSYGSNAQEASYFIINNNTIYADGGQNTGLNIVKVRKLTGNIVEFRNFRMSSPNSSDSVLNFLNTFDTTHYLLAGVAAFVSSSDSLRQTAKNKFRQFGSRYADSVTRFDQFDSWAFIGFLGADSSQISESFHRFSSNFNWKPSFASLSPVFLSNAGRIQFSTGPSHRWKYFNWQQTVPPGSQIRFSVTGITPGDDSVTIIPGTISNNYVNLDTVNSFTYPYLKLTAYLEIDSLSGFQSPLFRSMFFKYTPPCELIPDIYSVTKSDSLVKEGSDVNVSVKVHNVGFVPSEVTLHRWIANTHSGTVVLKSDTVFIPLNPDSIKISNVSFNTSGMKDPEKFFDTVIISFQTMPLASQNDYYGFNNFAFTRLIIFGDSTGPSIEVLVNGEKTLNGELIPAKPEITFRFYDDSKLTYDISDTNSIFIKKDGVRIPYSVSGGSNPQITFSPVNEGNLKTIITYKPELEKGDYIFSFIGSDKDGNKDTVNYLWTVTDAFQIRNLYNYPNPMKDGTNFTFVLYSSQAPEKCRIKIYTVTGRLIKEIISQARVGFNNIYWDGRDSDGEYIANGIYLYKLILEDIGRTESSIQKLAILR
ncbi:MAG: C25 family cysteine peptidase [Ignavibacteria bacterium]|nr:C25 family cysteine peptidase [Ignavibacteria bacterium]